MHKLLVGALALLLLAVQAQAQSGYAIQRGDTLRIEVLEDPNLNRSVLVLPDGSISFPLAGSVAAAGRTVDDLSAALVGALSSNFAAPPTVFVSVGQLAERPAGTGGGSARPRVVGIFAMGEVAKPGRIDAERGVTLLQALAQAGGFTRFAATRRIELHRTDPATGKEQVYLFNYRGGGISGSTPLQAGDVIVVPERRLFE
jgi:polysaccharide export outer membrane protein